MIRALLTLLLGISVGIVFGQQQGDYQSDQSGNWSASTTWEVFFNGAWRALNTGAAGPFQNVIPSSSSGVITVKHAVLVNVNTTTNQTIVDGSGVLTVRGSRTLTINDDGVNIPLQINTGGNLVVNGTLDLQTQMISTPCQVFGTLSSNSVILISNPSLLIFQPASTYVHFHRTGGNIPLATWDIGSTCRISGLTRTKPSPPGNLGQSFWNFEWNSPGMGAHSSFSLNGALQNVMGDFSFVASGSTFVRLRNGGPGTNLTIGGDLKILGGSLIIAQALTSTSTVTVAGDLVMSGGTFMLGNGNNTPVNLFLNGNFVKTGEF